MSIVDGNIRCGACEQWKPLAAFYPSTAALGYGQCRECAKSAWRAARAGDPERFEQYRRASTRRNPGSAKASAKKWADKKTAQYLAHPPTSGTIRCSSCREEKDISKFIPSVVARGCGVCRKCKQVAKRDYERRNPDKVKAARRAQRARRGDDARSVKREHYRNNPEAYRNYNLGRYGITTAEYDAILVSQGGGCACCGAKANRNGKRLFVDHDHKTGAVRGVLCHKCNAGIGALGDDLAGLRRAVAYLKRTAQPAPVHATPTMRINLLRGDN